MAKKTEANKGIPGQRRVGTAAAAGEDTTELSDVVGAPSGVKLEEAGEIPADLIAEGFDGDAVYHDKGGRAFWLKINLEADRGKTHVLKSKTHTWEGTEEEFRLQFTKE